MLDRVREQEPNHVRSIDVQSLDALLRIEELLQKLVDAGLATRVHDEVQIEGDVADLITDVEPLETPLAKALGGKKRKNPNHL